MKYQIFLVLLFLAVACTPQPTATTGPDTPVTNPPGDDMPMTEPAQNPFTPKPEDKNLSRDIVYIEEASLVIRESFPPQISLSLKGNLPTPCHQLRAEIRPPDPEKKIMADVYSVRDPDQVCVETLEPFEEFIDLGTFPTGHYTVWVNGELAGEFDT